MINIIFMIFKNKVQNYVCEHVYSKQNLILPTSDKISHVLLRRGKERNIYVLYLLRYESTIRGMFFGHNHGDSWQILYVPDDYVRPVPFSGPSGREDELVHRLIRMFT